MLRVFMLVGGLLLGSVALMVRSAEAPEADQGVPGAIAEPPPVVMVRIGSDEITVRDYLGYINGSTRRVELASTPEGRIEVLREMTGVILLQQAMRAEGLLKSENPGKAEVQKAYTQLTAQHFPRPPVPDEAAIKQYYEKHSNQFGIPPMVRISHIQFQVPYNAPDERRTESRKHAETVLQKLNSGTAFDKLAAEFSDNKNTAAEGGDAGFLDADTPWLKKALDGVKVGGHTGVVESPAGYEILLLTDRRDSILLPYEEVREKATQQLRDEMQEQARQNYIRQLAGKTEIVTVMEELDDIRL